MSNITALRHTRNVLTENAHTVAQQLLATEHSIDTAITNFATLTSAMIQLRQDARLSAVVGQDSLSSVSEAMNIIVRGRAALVEAHHQLAAQGKLLRIEPTSFGSLEEKP